MNRDVSIRVEPLAVVDAFGPPRDQDGPVIALAEKGQDAPDHRHDTPLAF